MIETMLRTMREFQRAFGLGARDGAVIELPGVVACMSPELGAHSLFNAAIWEREEDLRRALPELDRRYRDAGVAKWGVWSHRSATGAAAILEEFGLELDSSPASMGRELDATLEPPGGAAPTVERAMDLAELDRVEAAAWGFDEGVIAHGQPRVLEQFNCYVVRDEHGRAGAAVGTLHHEGDCGVTLVATAPEARGRGYATAGMRHALAEAARAGCTTTTLQATAAGKPLYLRLGYRDFGPVDLWELRSG